MGDNALPAGDFAAWLGVVQAGRRDDGIDVPCGGCTGCCTSSYFVHVEPDEGETLAHIPRELLFPAPGLPAGHMLVGYDERGHCPMLVDGACSIYEHRPRTCRTFDCRVFAAAGVEPGGGDKAEITHRLRRWRFAYASAADRRRHAAIRRAARYLRERAGDLPGDAVPSSPTGHALLALRIHELFLDIEGDEVEPDRVASAIAAARRA